MTLTHVGLFAGIGGFEKAVEEAGFKTILMVENAEFPKKVLKKHWPDVQIIDDVRDIDGIKEAIMAYSESERQRPGLSGRGIKLDGAEKRGDIAQCRQKKSVENASSQRSGSSPGNAVHKGRATRKSGRESLSQATRRQDGAAIADDKPADINGQTPRRTLPTITLLSGGVPCQPASNAGKQRGEADDRWLWPETFRIVEELKPIWCLFENVSGLLTLEDGLVFDNLLSELESKGYEVQSLIIPACAVNAPHRRDRVWIVAHSRCQCGDGWSSQRRGQEEAGSCDRVTRSSEYADTVADSPGASRNGQTQGQQQGKIRGRNTQSGTVIADTSSAGLQGTERAGSLSEKQRASRPTTQCHSNTGEYRQSQSELGGMVDGPTYRMDGHFDTEPDIPRVATGISGRVNRLKALGNAVVWQVPYQIIKVIAEIENERE